ncbi:unnamed protein product [Cladocopium goreaui]|uniref:E3 ubiquitin-protein ligase HERC1 n=1 Tax=Cladocopium goreaui TaxID=2562237 RepID=A0A9P1FGG3_9DINO|nr:unnamed protein product [Cladocopium goreaui]
MSMALFIAVGSVDSQRLVDSAGELLKPWQRAEEVGLQEGSSVTAVVRCAHLIGDRTARGFAVLKADGGVVAWGHPSYGGDSRRAAPQLKDVAKVFANCGAFAAIRCDGTVVTWGHPNCGGNCRKVQAQLQEASLGNLRNLPDETGVWAAQTQC